MEFLEMGQKLEGLGLIEAQKKPNNQKSSWNTHTTRQWVNLNFIFICFVKALPLLLSLCQPRPLTHFVLKGQQEKLKLL